MWWIEPLEIANAEGKGTGRFRLTARSDEGGGGPFGDTSHDHASKEEARACDQCDEFCSQIAGMPSRKARKEAKEEAEQKEYERLKQKFES